VLADATLTRAVRRKILIADDNVDGAESLSVLLQLAGHEVRVAHLGRTALSQAEIFRPHVILLDIGMPDLNGYEVGHLLRREPWARGILMIAVTGWGQEEDRRLAAEAGFDHHLCKPVDPDVLSRLIGSELRALQVPGTWFSSLQR
jgi:CheY-like chemotaxis protein